jgi:uncharacterized membrane protein YedE/YeeE
MFMTDTVVPSETSVSIPRAVVGGTILATLLAWAWSLYGGDQASRALSFSLLAGAAFGIVLQRGRFCFLCNFRDFIEKRDPRGVLSIIVALAVGFVLYQVVFLAWVPVPQPDRLPPTAHVGPASPVLALAAFVFGLGMAVSNSCISAHLYRLGEGSPTAPFALIGAAIGFVLGFLTWNRLFLSVISEWPAIWLPHHLGYTGTAVVTLAALAGLALLVLAAARPQETEPRSSPTLRSALCGIFIKRWPAALTGIAIGVIAMAAYFRVAPLGVTAELGSLARTGASSFNLLPETLYGLDGLRGCATVVKEAIFSNNGVFVIGLVAASFASALVAGQFTPEAPNAGHVVRGLVGGVLMGWGAMIGLGCTVGVLLSGIHAGALAGWVFLAFCTLGVWLGLLGMRRIGQ